MKSSKYTQVTSSKDNEICDYQNRSTTTTIPSSDSNIGQTAVAHTEFTQSYKQHTNNSEEILLNSNVYERGQTIYEMQQCSGETNVNKYHTDEEIELMCNCAVYANKQKLKQSYASEQNISSTNRKFSSLTKLDACANSSQFSLDRKSSQHQAKQEHVYTTCEQGQKVMQRIERVPSLKRIQSPEIINIHRGPNTVLYESYGSENCQIKSYNYDKDFKCDDYGFKRGQSFKRSSERSNGSQCRSSKRRPAGDGIDAEMDEPELILELTEQMRDCQCACDHVMYVPGYTTCLPLLPVSVELNNITVCTDNEDLPIHIIFHIKNYDDGRQSLYGNASLRMIIDNQVVMTVLRMKKSADENWIPDKIYMRDSNFCKIMDNYLRRTTETAPGTHLKSFCPMHRGSYQFYDFTPDFKEIQFPVEMLGYIKLRIELERPRADDGQREMVACNEIELEERFPPAPDVTRRLGASTPLGKPESSTPPYYRSASAASSSSNSASSRIDLSTRHWWIIATVLLLAAAAGVGVPIALKISSGASLDERLEFASRLLQEVPLIDGHNDLPWNIRKFLHNRLKDFKFGEDLRNVSPWSTSAWSHTDLPRLKQGHVAAQFWAAYVPCDSQHKDAVQLTLEQIDVIRRLTEMYQPSLTLCTSSRDIRTAYEKNQLCSLIGVEGGHSLAGSLAVLRTLYHVGVRYLTLTSTCNTPWADCSHADMPGKKPEHGGLTNFGKSVVKEMNRLGMIVDLSHVSVKTMRDALDVSKAPVIFSHSSAHALCNSTRNVPDATLRKLALNKGVVMVNFYSHFLTCKDVATVADAVAHINHIREVAGVDNVGLGAGYDGINYVPQGLEDVSSYPTLFAELIGTGKWTIEDLKKLAGLNFLRVFQDVERVRDEFKKAKVPPYEDVLIPRPKINNCSSQDPF